MDEFPKVPRKKGLKKPTNPCGQFPLISDPSKVDHTSGDTRSKLEKSLDGTSAPDAGAETSTYVKLSLPEDGAPQAASIEAGKFLSRLGLSTVLKTQINTAVTEIVREVGNYSGEEKIHISIRKRSNGNISVEVWSDTEGMSLDEYSRIEEEEETALAGRKGPKNGLMAAKRAADSFNIMTGERLQVWFEKATS
jgi:anti-sigma regulatory factor (Ser/Thr protein kinase)